MSKEHITILFIGEESNLREVLEYASFGLPHLEIQIVADHKEALQLIEQRVHIYDVVVNDSGDEIAVADFIFTIKNQGYDIEIIGFVDEGTEAKAHMLHAGATYCLSKPYHVDELVMAIRSSSQQVRLRRLSRTIMSKRNLDGTLETISAAVKSFSLADEVCIALWNDMTNSLDLYPEPTEPTLWRKHFRKGSVTLNILRSGNILKISDTTIDDRIHPTVVQSGIRSILGVPISGIETNLGVLYVYGRNKGQFNDVTTVDILHTLAGQAGLAIANIKTLKRLEAVQRVAATIGLSPNLEDVLTATCRAAVEFFGVDHSGMVRSLPDGRGQIKAEYPPRIGTEGVIIPMQGVPDEDSLVENQEPLMVSDVENQDGLGDVRLFLLKYDIQSVLIVPVSFKGRFLGSFGLDMIGRKRTFSDEEIEQCKLFANQAAVVIANAEAYEKAELRARYLETVQNISEAISSLEDPTKVYEIICKAAVELFSVKHCGLVLFDNDFAQGTVVAEYPYEGMIGMQFPLQGNEMEMSLIDRCEPIFMSEVEEAPEAVIDQYRKIDIRSAWYIPIIHQDRLIGSLGLDIIGDEKQLTVEQLELCQTFATQAATAIEQARLQEKERESTQKAEWRARKLEAIRKVNEAINEKLDLNETMEIACRAAVELFEVDHSGLVLFDPDLAQGIVKAEFPQHIGTLGTSIQIEGVSDEEELVVRKQPLLIQDVAGQESLGIVQETLRKFDIQSILVVPMIFNKRVIGSFSLDCIGRKRYFSQDEIDLCMILAGQVASAVDNAQVHERATRLAEHWRQIVADSPTAVIAADQYGDIIDSNKHAQRILGYSAHEMKNLHVAKIYYRQEEAYNIGNHLRAAKDEKISDYETLIRSKTDAIIPVRLAVTYLHDASDQKAGTIGHFEDMRYVQEKQRVFAHSAIFQRISDSIQSSEDLNEVFFLVLTGVTAGFGLGFNSAALFLVNAENNLLVGKTGIGHFSEQETYRIWGDIYAHGLNDIQRFQEELQDVGIPITPIGDKVKGLELAIDPAGQDVLSEVIRSGHWQRLETVDDLERLPPSFRDSFGPQAPLVAVALRSGRRVIGLLVADNRFTRTPVTDEAITTLISFANTASIAIYNSQILKEIKLEKEYLEKVRQESLSVGEQVEQEPLLQEIVTRAYKLLNARSGGVYEYVRERKELKIVADYPGDRLILGQILKPGEGMAGRLIQSDRPYLATDNYDMSEFRAPQFQRERLFGAVIEVPMRWRGEIVGVLYVDDKIGRAFGADDARLLQLFSDHAASALVNAQVLQDSNNARQKLHEAFAQAVALTVIGKPEQVLKDAVESARQMSQADWVSVVLIDNKGHARNLLVSGEGGVKDVDQIVRTTSEGSLSRRVMATCVPEIIEKANTHEPAVNPDMISRGIRSALCLPFTVHGETIGVMWFHYHQPQEFLSSQSFVVDALQLFANQAAVAYDSSLKIETLEHLHRAASVLAATDSPEEMLRHIVESAADVLGAKSTAIWSYDSARGTFLIDESTAVGIGEEDWESFRKAAPRAEGTAARVMKGGWIGIEDIYDRRHSSYLGTHTVNRLQKTGVRSFQGICLQTSEEKLGVLYVNYARPQGFTAEERRISQTFADYAALALQKARLIRRIQKSKDTAGVVARMTVLQDLPSTLKAVVEGTKSALGCDAVALYGYIVEKKQLQHPPTMIGVENTDAKHRGQIVYDMLELDQPYIVPDTSQDPKFRDRRFTIEEKIASVIVIPLSVHGRRVGVMFVNYRNPHRFSDEEIADIQLFANQAAVAIHDAQIFDKEQNRSQALRALNRAGQAKIGHLSQQDVLNQVVKEAWRLSRRQDKKALFANIVLIDGNNIEFVVAYPFEELDNLHLVVGRSLERASGISDCTGIIGRALLTKTTQLVNDVSSDSDYIQAREESRSELVVPIILNGQVIGAINVEHPELDAFDTHDQKTMETLASHTALALGNVRYAESLTAIRTTSAAVSAVLDLDELLTMITDESEHIFNAPATSVMLWDDAQQNLIIKAAYGLGDTYRTQQKIARNVVEQFTVDENIVPHIFPIGSKPLGDRELVEQAGLHSVLVAPLTASDGRLNGVLNIYGQSGEMQFTEQDIELAAIFANQASIAIQNAEQYQDLKQIKGYVGSHTALAWMKMMRSNWKHEIGGKVGLAKAVTYDIEKTLSPGDDHAGQMQEKIIELENMLNDIADTMLTEPLGSETEVSSILINELMSEYVTAKKTQPHCSDITFEFTPFDEPYELHTVRASKAWLRRLFNIIVDNATDAMRRSETPHKVIHFQSRIIDNDIYISIANTGPEIPNEIRAQMFELPIEKAKGDLGSGMGLMEAQAIVETYDGRIWHEPTAKQTKFNISLPSELVK